MCWSVLLSCLSICLLVIAVVRAWGDQAVINVRSGPGFFGTGPDGLTNATHLVFLATIPLLLLSLSSVIQAVGLTSQEHALLKQDRRVWSSLALDARHIIIAQEVLPRLPVLALVLTPPAAVASLRNLTEAELRLIVGLISIAVTVELLRVAAASWRLTRRLGETARSLRNGVAAVGSALLVGSALGIFLRALSPFFERQVVNFEPAALTAMFIASNLDLVVIFSVLVSVASCAFIWRTCSGLRAFHPNAHKAIPIRTLRHQRLTTWAFPIATPERLLAAAVSPESQAALLMATALTVLSLSPGPLASQIITILAVTSMMAFCLTRLAPWGVSSSLTRMRHHFELGADPTGHSLRLAVLSGAVVLPVSLPLVWILVLVDMPPVQAVGLVLWPVGATLVADAVVARPGSLLTENKLLLLALVQSLLTAIGWTLFVFNPAAGWLFFPLMIGVYGWLLKRRQILWLPRVQW